MDVYYPEKEVNVETGSEVHTLRTSAQQLFFIRHVRMTICVRVYYIPFGFLTETNFSIRVKTERSD